MACGEDRTAGDGVREQASRGLAAEPPGWPTRGAAPRGVSASSSSEVAVFALPRWDATFFLRVMLVTRGALHEDVLVRSNNSRLGHVAPAVDTLLEAYERVVNTSLGLHPQVAPNVCQEPVSWSLRNMVSTVALHDRVVNNFLGPHPQVAPSLYQAPSLWPGKAFVA